jgi:hypothetical protein
MGHGSGEAERRLGGRSLCSWAVRPLKFPRAALVVHSGLPQNPHGPLGPNSTTPRRHAEGLAARAPPPPVAAVRHRGRSPGRAGGCGGCFRRGRRPPT